MVTSDSFGSDAARATNHNSLKLLAKSILNRLENNKYIVFNPRERGELQEALFTRLSKEVLTEEDLNSQVRADVEKNSGAINDQNLTETDAFKSQKKALKARLGDNQLHGFYFTNSLRNLCQNVGQFLFDTSLVEDVFESDENIHKLVMETIQKFDESKIA